MSVDPLKFTDSLNSTYSFNGVEPFDFTQFSKITTIKYDELPDNGESIINKQRDLHDYIIKYIGNRENGFYYCVLKLEPIDKNRVDNDACRLLIINKNDSNTQLYCYKINIVYRRLSNRIYIRTDRLHHFMTIYYENQYKSQYSENNRKKIIEQKLIGVNRILKNFKEDINTYKRKLLKSSDTYNFNKIIAMSGINITPIEPDTPPLSAPPAPPLPTSPPPLPPRPRRNRSSNNPKKMVQVSTKNKINLMPKGTMLENNTPSHTMSEGIMSTNTKTVTKIIPFVHHNIHAKNMVNEQIIQPTGIVYNAIHKDMQFDKLIKNAKENNRTIYRYCIYEIKGEDKLSFRLVFIIVRPNSAIRIRSYKVNIKRTSSIIDYYITQGSLKSILKSIYTKKNTYKTRKQNLKQLLNKMNNSSTYKHSFFRAVQYSVKEFISRLNLPIEGISSNSYSGEDPLLTFLLTKYSSAAPDGSQNNLSEPVGGNQTRRRNRKY